MSKQHKRALALAAVAALAVALVVGGLWKRRAGASAGPTAAARPALPAHRPTRFEALPRVVARIGATEITKDDLRPVLDTDDEAGPDGTAPVADDGDFYATALWLAAESEVMNRVLVAEAHRQGYALSADELAGIAMPDDQRAQLDQVAPQFGMTGADLIARRADARLVEKLVVTEIYDKVPVAEDEIVDVFEHETSAFFRPDGYRIRRVVLRPHSNESDADLLARAEALAKKLAGPGADFAALARRTTDAPERATGGLMADFTMADPPSRDPGFLSAVLSLEPGRMSRPIRIADGYQILRLEERLPPQRMTLDEARPQIVKHLQWSKGGPQALAWAEALAGKAGAQILVPMPEEVARSRAAMLGGAP